MRNYAEEIRELTSEINDLSLAKSKKESQLERVLREQKENEKRGDWVRATTSGKFNLIEGTVVRINKWITFEDCTGVKQIRAPKNLLISNYGRKCASRPGNNANSRK